jgi:hypothetical protein
MKKFLEAVLAKHKHMALKASPHHPHSQALVYTPGGKEVVRPIDTADAGYGGEAVSDAEGGEADPGKASKKAVAPMKMPTLVKPGLDKAKANEETERERLMKLRSFAAKGRKEGLGKAMVEEEQIDELKKSTLASYAKKATDDVSYHSFTAGTMSSKDPERLAQDKKAMKRQTGVIKAIDRLAKEEVELDERNMENKAKKDNVVRQVGTHAFIKHGTDAGSPKLTGRKVMSDPKVKSSKVADMYRKLPSMEEAANVTDYNPKSQGGTRVELLQKLAKSKSPEHATAARKAGATQDELKKAMASEEYQVVAHSKTGEKFKSGLYPTKDKAQSMHYKLAKSNKHRKVELVKVSEENDGTEADAGEYGYEGDMAMSQLKSIIRNAKDLHDHMEAQTDLPEWLQSKITLAADYIQTAADYWRSEKEEAMSEGKADVRVTVHKDVEDFLKKGGMVKKFAPSKATHRPGTALASKMIGTTGQVPGMARKIGGKKPVVAVEEGKMKDIATDKAEDERLAKLAAEKSKKQAPPPPRVGPMEKALEEGEVWDKPMPDSAKKGSLSPEQKAKAKARADRAGRSYPNMIDNMWASKQ